MDHGQRSVFMVDPDPYHWCVFVCVYARPTGQERGKYRGGGTTGQERGKYAKILNKTLTLDFIQI